MKHLGYRKRGRAPMTYEFIKDGLNRYLKLCDKSGVPVAVVEIELETIREILNEFL